ncbi:MAG TPA: helix-turn-helix domain-containing protein [Vicinamibacterales bacterium]|nr:helix-turn-helix domain-containing protein [Vicinamibacterales bacterium]
MPESFGARLRRQRERQRVTLAAIAEHTKIHLPLLEELEEDRVAHWPSGIFRRAFIRAYADAIGLRPDDVVREFLALYPDPIEVVSIGSALENAAKTKRRPPTRFQYFVGAASEWVLETWRRTFVKGVEVDEPPAALPLPRSQDAADIDLLAAASLCTKFAQSDVDSDVTLLLAEASRILDAIGVIVWTWEPETGTLRPSISDGYSDRVLSQLPTVRRDADNATAAAFRSVQTCAVAGADGATSALAVPVMAPSGCVGVLAVELRNGAEQAAPVRAVATMLAAQVGRLIEAACVSREQAARRRA